MIRRRWSQEAKRVHVDVLKAAGIAVLSIDTTGDADHAFEMSIADLERLRHDIDAVLPRLSEPD